MRSFRCVWDFGGAVGQERGWEITHYFRNEEETAYEVQIRAADGRAVAAESKVWMRFQPRLREPWRRRTAKPERWLSDRGKVETERLLSAMLIAVLALLGGAREQLMKLDVFPGLVAVSLLGFGADTVKSLFTRRS